MSKRDQRQTRPITSDQYERFPERIDPDRIAMIREVVHESSLYGHGLYQWIMQQRTAADARRKVYAAAISDVEVEPAGETNVVSLDAYRQAKQQAETPAAKPAEALKTATGELSVAGARANVARIFAGGDDAQKAA